MSDDINRLKEAEKASLDETNEAVEGHKDEYGTHVSRSSSPAAPRSTNNWLGGVILIAIGLIFLFTNLGVFTLNNWWALFIMIPAVFNFGNAVSDYQRHGRLTKSGRGSITGGLILSLIAFTFLLSWDWGIIWPIFLIIGGIGALLGGWFD